MKLRVLVFGATGTGKTSLCNALANGSRPTDSGALGVTDKTHLYAPFTVGETTFELVDTVGLHESLHGTVPADRAVVALVELLEKSREGFNLMVHVARASRITKEHDEDYKFFVEKMAQNRIPVLLAVTGCENEDPMSSWVDKNQSAFSRFAYKALVPTCFAVGGQLEEFYASRRDVSRESLLGAIQSHATSESVLLFGPGTGSTFNDALTRIWNEFVTLAGLPAKYRRKVNESAYAMLKRIGVPKSVADAMVRHIPDLAEEVGAKIPIPGSGKVLKYAARRLLDVLLKRG
jgi:GTPase SAR1 family protein